MSTNLVHVKEPAGFKLLLAGEEAEELRLAVQENLGDEQLEVPEPDVCQPFAVPKAAVDGDALLRHRPDVDGAALGAKERDLEVAALGRAVRMPVRPAAQPDSNPPIREPVRLF